MTSNWQKKVTNIPYEWLLSSNPWTKYRTYLDLLDEPPNSKNIKNLKQELLEDKNIKKLINETTDWYSTPATRHNDAKISHYKLTMLGEFGLTKKDPGLSEIIEKATEHIDEGMFAFKQALPERGKNITKEELKTLDEWHALPCDAPIITYALLLLNHKVKSVKNSVEVLKNRWKSEIGWFCNLFFVSGQFKRLQVGCPMAGLMALQVFSLFDELKESDFAKNAFAPLKYHYESKETLYYFGRSKKFWTFKYPFVWYNALYLADVLTRFKFLKKEPLVKELVEWVKRGFDQDMKVKPNSIFRIYADWDFGNKREQSPWITYLCLRILKQWYS